MACSFTTNTRLEPDDSLESGKRIGSGLSISIMKASSESRKVFKSFLNKLDHGCFPKVRRKLSFTQSP